MLNIAPSHHIVCDCAPALGRGRQSRRCRTLHKDPKAISFDYLVGGGQQCRWYREAERLGGFQINTIFERELCTASQQNGPLTVLRRPAQKVETGHHREVGTGPFSPV